MLAGAGLLALVALGIPAVLGTGEHALERCTRHAREGDGIDTRGWSWRPLGIRCEITHPDGTVDRFVTGAW